MDTSAQLYLNNSSYKEDVKKIEKELPSSLFPFEKYSMKPNRKFETF